VAALILNRSDRRWNAKRCEWPPKKKFLKPLDISPDMFPWSGIGCPASWIGGYLTHTYVYGGAGDANFTLKINPRNIEKVNKIAARIE